MLMTGFSSFSNLNREKLKYAIHFCKSIDTDDYARVNLPSGEGDASGSSDSGELSEAGESDQVEPRTKLRCRCKVGLQERKK